MIPWTSSKITLYCYLPVSLHLPSLSLDFRALEQYWIGISKDKSENYRMNEDIKILTEIFKISKIQTI